MATPSSSSQALVKRKAESALMAPPPPPKKIKRPKQVLSEEAYQAGISYHISKMLGRDETEAQYEYMLALESKDEEAIDEAGRKLTIAMTPKPEGRQTRSMAGRTPLLRATAGKTPTTWIGATPASETEATAPLLMSEEQKIELKSSLTEFQATYTSEDSESAYQSLDALNMKKRQQKPWLYSETNQLPSKRQIAVHAHEERMNAAAKDPAKAMELATRAAPDQRPAAVAHKRTTPFNSLMFYPASIEDTHETWAQAAARQSKAPPRQILHHNTRLPPPSSAAAALPPSPSLSAIDAAIAGRPRPAPSEAGLASATPRVAGYAFVDSESPAGERAAAAQVDHAALQALLRSRHGGGGAGGPGAFRLREEGAREGLGRRAVERVAAAAREKAQAEKGAADVPRFESAAGLTPAARKAAGGLTPAQQKLLGLATAAPRRRAERWKFGGRKEAGGGAAATVRTLLGVTPVAKK